MILAGDVGGTKTLLALFDPQPQRPVAVVTKTFRTLSFESLADVVEQFFRGLPVRPPITAAAFGVAGPVIDDAVKMTNVPWRVNAADLAPIIGVGRVHLLNDLEAMAHAVPALRDEDLATLQPGMRHPEGNVALIAAGTGLGGAILRSIDGRLVPLSTELGHSDFAARTPDDVDFVGFARARYGRVDIEAAVSGPGLVNLSDFTHRDTPCAAQPGGHLPKEAEQISAAGLAASCAACRVALEMFVAAYGAAAGNLALIAVATGGVFIAGGIAPKILPALSEPAFLTAFNDKGPMRYLMERMPVQVVLNQEVGLLGAAVAATEN